MGLRSTVITAAAIAAIVVVGVVAIVFLWDTDDDDQIALDNTPSDTAQSPTEAADDGETPEGGATGQQASPTATQSADSSPTAADNDEGNAAGEQANPTATQPAVGTLAPAPTPPAEDTFGFGESASNDLIAEFDIDIPPDGEGLPEGSGTPEEGEQVYAEECAACHGPTGSEGGLGPQLVSEPGPWEEGMPRTIGSYWPYATTVYDYTNRAMPFDEPGSLEPDEVYAVTAYLLWQNQIIDEGDEMNAETLPEVEMPNEPQFESCWPDLCRFEDDSGS